MSTDNTQNKPKAEDSAPKDEYYGRYKGPQDGKSEAELYGTQQMPVQNDPLPAKGLKSVGG